MRIIRPYGRSATTHEPEDRRRLIRSDAPKDETKIEEFASEHMELVIAQWISVIDKIATKPTGQKKPTAAQYMLRAKLGAAAWEQLRRRLEIDLEKAKKIWDWKLHPYGNNTDEEKHAKGRWYKRFAGEASLEEIDVEDVARKIETHLYDAALSANGKTKPKGAIEHRAASIAKNVLRDIELQPLKGSWDDYFKPGDVAQQIKQMLDEKKKKAGDRKYPARISLHGEAAKLLHEHYAKLFTGDGQVPGIAEAREMFPDLFARHMAIKDVYRALFNRRIKWDSLLRVAPDDRRALQNLVENKARNRELAALVRLGKVLHYEDPGCKSEPEGASLKKSAYWLSDGQTGIKRGEALLRIFHESISHANLIIRDWLKDAPSDPIGDGKVLEKLDRDYCADRHKQKMPLLFGEGANCFNSQPDEDILKAMIRGWMAIRHRVFHFTSLAHLKKALSEQPEELKALLGPIEALWKQDKKAEQERLKQTLIGAHIEKFLSQERANGLWKQLTEGGTAALPLPRFNRVLDRAEKIRSGRGLPPPAHQRKLQGEKNTGRLCQYVCLKLLYERSFRAWLKDKENCLTNWLETALKRTTGAAQDINTNEDSELIRAKAEKLALDATSLTAFLQDLSRHTAGEMRVQRGYESDGIKAAEQAKYIDDLLCDVLAIAFPAYLEDRELNWLTPKKDAFKSLGTCKTDALSPDQVDTPGEDWVPGLYFLLHATSVEAVGRLSHQLAKWEISGAKLEKGLGKEDKVFLENLQKPLKLFLNMHDARHEGSGGLDGSGFADLFESEDVFKEIFPREGADDDARLPLRGLREIMRYGHRPVIEQICGEKISCGEVREYRDSLDRDSPEGIAQLQQEQEDSRRDWSKHKKKRDWVKNNGKRYDKRLRDIVKHRHLAARVTLTDAVRAHKLLMSVLSRLADYAWLFERDLYFVTRALLHRQEKSPQEHFDDKKLEKFKGGQILHALRGDPLEEELAAYFDLKQKGIRNDLAHFNLLHEGDSEGDSINLTDYVNKTRRLMGYDRKLKNAVSKSIIELLAREGLTIRWKMTGHDLCAGSVECRCISHLGGNKINGKAITEELHGPAYAKMICRLFFPPQTDRLNGGEEAAPERREERKN